ncbi:hypothetical protein, partial [Flavonifractor plautii]|uniref:hypothetical protein n=1 Tax=Flavonifractor plautii TaxID=292800 RepID=UPI003D7E8322
RWMFIRRSNPPFRIAIGPAIAPTATPILPIALGTRSAVCSDSFSALVMDVLIDSAAPRAEEATLPIVADTRLTIPDAADAPLPDRSVSAEEATAADFCVDVPTFPLSAAHDDDASRPAEDS